MAGVCVRELTRCIGFGGSNVHVILESYVRPPRSRVGSASSLIAVEDPLFTPFTFSASSEQALTTSLKAYSDHLEDCGDHIRLGDLAWTLQYRRSQGPYRYAIAASTLDELVKRLKSATKEALAKTTSAVYIRAAQPSPSPPLRIMAIFTGKTTTADVVYV